MLILGIESSCDETGVGLYDATSGLLSHALNSQILIHREFGGVVPELASRDHIKYLIPVINEALIKADKTLKDVSAIAYTKGPGLIGALLAGASFAKSLSFALDIPAIGVHHLEAHLLAAMLDCKDLDFPFIVLLVSGGHTQLIKANSFGDYELLGETLDDAVGEAFDKTAKLLGIPYPGGPVLAQMADKCQFSDLPLFPRPMLKSKDLNFSFSGLKTHALTVWQKSDKSQTVKAKIAKSFQDAVIDTLIAKSTKAILEHNCEKLVVAGGVGANLKLRSDLRTLAKEHKIEVFFPKIEFCTDNGAMVAFAGYLNFAQGLCDNNYEINVKARWPLT